MRDFLARCMILGEMNVVAGNGLLDTDEHDRATLKEVLKSLPEDFFEITVPKALASLRARAENDRAVAEGISNLLEMMEAQQSHPDGNITLGEATRRWE